MSKSLEHIALGGKNGFMENTYKKIMVYENQLTVKFK